MVNGSESDMEILQFYQRLIQAILSRIILAPFKIEKIEADDPTVTHYACDLGELGKLDLHEVDRSDAEASVSDTDTVAVFE